MTKGILDRSFLNQPVSKVVFLGLCDPLPDVRDHLCVHCQVQLTIELVNDLYGVDRLIVVYQYTGDEGSFRDSSCSG